MNLRKFRVTYYDPSFNIFTPRRSIVRAACAYDAEQIVARRSCIGEIVSVKEIVDKPKKVEVK